ncbi:MAG TPA: glutathione S-transferase family protein [Candidatus Acidoferrales bacterium]|nr:glutathione S-transferase family protein [Candidatus Acidoferrales bacterium]
MIELYHNDMSVCAQKVRFALAEKKLKWEGHHLNLRAGDQQRPEYLKLNPNAVVPTLVDDGKVIIESTVICEYLDDAYPEPPLRPGDSVSRARMRLWTKQLDEGVHAATSVVSSAIAFRYQKLAISMEALEKFHEKMPDPVKRDRSWENVTKGIESRYFPESIKRFDKLLADMETALAEHPWLAGREFSLADIAYAPYITRLDHLQLQFLWDKRPRIPGWYERLMERRAYKEALEDWFNASYLPLMKEKGAEVQSRVKGIIASA